MRRHPRSLCPCPEIIITRPRTACSRKCCRRLVTNSVGLCYRRAAMPPAATPLETDTVILQGSPRAVLDEYGQHSPSRRLFAAGVVGRHAMWVHAQNPH